MSTAAPPDSAASVAALPHLAARADFARLWRAQGLHSGLTLGEELRAGVERHAGTSLVFGSRDHPSETRLDDLYRQAIGLASALSQDGFARGDVLVGQLPNWRESAVTMLAAMHLGLVYIPVIHIYGERELGFLLRQSQARGLAIPDRWRGIDFLARVSNVGSLPDLKRVLVVGKAPASGPNRNWHEFAAAGKDIAPHVGDPDAVALISFTSGTSGEPKGVLHTHHSLGAETRSFPLFPKAEDHAGPMFWMLPGGHIGATVSMLRPFLCGETGIYIDHFDPALALDLMRAHRPRRIGGVPFHLNALFDLASPADLDSVTQASTGGAGVPPELIREAGRRGIAISRCFGLTEHPSVTSCRPGDPLDRRAETDGRPLSGCIVRIVDDAGADCASGTAGEILTLGPDLCKGYLATALNAAAFTPDGWFRTGDIGILDDDGYLAVTDRKKDLIIRGGENLASREIELILADHPAIAEAAVVAWPHDRLGECVGAFIRLTLGRTIGLADIQAHFAAAGVARQKTPEHLVMVEDFPRSAMGKILKAELRKQIPPAG